MTAAVSADRALRLLTGPAGTGKTFALVERAAAAVSAGDSQRILVSAPRPAAASRLRALVAAALGIAEGALAASVGIALERLALEIIDDAGLASGIALDPTLVDDGVAERVFSDIAAPLYALEWSEFLTDELDPEVSGLRTPERFARAALTLIRKLRDARIGPVEFLDASMRGATEFYGNPPNFADPRLLASTREDYRDSLVVDRAELERQRRREIDLAKVLARLYRSYDDAIVARATLGPSDALIEAARILRESGTLQRRHRGRFEAAFVDDAQDLTPSAVGFLRALFGSELDGVTLAGDPDQATRVFAGARPDRIFALAGVTERFTTNYRFGPCIAAAANVALERPAGDAGGAPQAVQLFRAQTSAEEARFVADAAAALIGAGAQPAQIAVITRSLRCLEPFERALLDRNVRVAHTGEFDLFADHDVRDALAVLWCAVDPFEHAFLLRVLQLPSLGFDDRTLATLCGEPSDPQALLFELPPEEMQGQKRWDRRRDLRLGMNVVRGDRDPDLTPEARRRLERLREARERWSGYLARAPLADASRRIIAESGLGDRRDGENDARRDRRLALHEAVLERIASFAAADPRRDLEAFLREIDRDAETLPRSDTRRNSPDAVVLGDVEAVKGEEFEHAFVVDVRAGAFAPYYAPDAFLFSPKYGMIPKEAVGDARASRTAKFTWYQHSAKMRDAFAREHRRAFACAITRARSSVTITAAGRATRGVAAPELLDELEKAPALFLKRR